jgi:hypothetical protein
MGLLPQSGRHRAHFRGCRRRAMRDPDGRCAIGGLARALPGIGACGALRRERAGGDVRPDAGVRTVRAVTAGATLVLGSPSLGLIGRPFCSFTARPPVGKLTVAKELAEGRSFRILHNHLTIDSCRRDSRVGHTHFWDVAERLREDLVGSAANERVSVTR